MAVELFEIETWYVFLVILSRMAAIMGSLPIFTASQAAMRLRLGVAAGLAVLLFPVLDISLAVIDQTPAGLIFLMAQEAMLGFLLGFVIQLIFFAVQFGGTIVGYQMGFAAANILDPQHQQQIPLLSQFQNVFAILLFLALDIHHLVIRVMARSYEVMPPGNLDMEGGAVLFLMDLTGQMFVLGLQLVAPVMAVLMVSMFILGIMSRVFSQLQVFLLSFPINISLALIFLGLGAELAFVLLEREFSQLPDKLMRILQMG
ncbi:flagellar biosynthetic protein FliR [Desulfosalsimonas propionicica]|uniref:Flagellar biosynthetic protein FliR n=1 Tax=Desulfosalsimonas propionicica TaxID=332175 RepID=A0A7W0HKI3_9BACT|nr:flagellar biosynthetic protein FliR [Desulfosalsimonas propionicica]MBA2881314.1 flagellar biosynthetic protein FliR [Desulfosalsimonas propionicica]